MGFLSSTVNAIFHPLNTVKSGVAKVESAFEQIINVIVGVFETSMGILVIGGTCVLLLLAKHPKLLLLPAL